MTDSIDLLARCGALLRPVRRALSGAVVACAVLVVLASGTAAAHNELESTSPAAGETLAVAPTTWTLTFISSVPLDSASAEVVRADGSRADLGAPVHGAIDRSIVFALPADLTGAVTARWRLVGTDGHVISGRVPFTVGSAPAAQQPTATTLPIDTGEAAADTSSAQRDAARMVLRVAGYLALLAVGGILFADFYVAQGTTRLARSRTALRWGTAGLAVAPLGQLLMLSADLGDTSLAAALSGLGEALDTTTGMSLAVRAVIGVALAVLVSAGLQQSFASRSHNALIAMSCAAYLVAMVMVGHSRSMPLPWLGVPLGAAHGAAAAVWLGGLAVLVLVVVPKVTLAQSILAFQRYSWAAQVAVGVLVATGAGQALRIHGLPDSVLGSAHGRLLLAKVAVVAAMVALGAANRKRLSDRTDHDSRRVATQRRIVVSSLAEAAFGAVVVVLTSVMADASPDADG